MTTPFCLTNHFLIAMPNMVDEDFLQSVVYVFDHNHNGAAGVVINQPSEDTLDDLFKRMDMPLRRNDLRGKRVLVGGPTHQDRGFVLHAAQPTITVGNDGTSEQSNIAFYASTMMVQGGIELTTSRDIMEALSQGTGPQKMELTLGYALWQADQLEAELAQNLWLTAPFDPKVLFDTPHQERHQAALGLLGVRPDQHVLMGGRA